MCLLLKLLYDHHVSFRDLDLPRFFFLVANKLCLMNFHLFWRKVTKCKWTEKSKWSFCWIAKQNFKKIGEKDSQNSISTLHFPSPSWKWVLDKWTIWMIWWWCHMGQGIKIQCMLTLLLFSSFRVIGKGWIPLLRV